MQPVKVEWYDTIAIVLLVQKVRQNCSIVDCSLACVSGNLKLFKPEQDSCICECGRDTKASKMLFK